MVRLVLAAETGWSNSGDDLMLRGTAAALRELDPAVDLTVISPNAWQVRTYLDPEVACVESPLLTLDAAAGGAGSRLSRRQRAAVERVLADGRAGRRDPEDPVRQSLHAVAGADAVVFAGGGYLTDQWPLTVRNARSLGEVATECGRPYVVFGHSIGPLRERRPRADVAGLLRGARAVAAREPASAREAAALTDGAPAEVVGDPALLAPEVTAEGPPAERVVVNLRDHGPDGRVVRAAVARAVEDVARRFGFELGFVEAGRPPSYDDAAAHGELDALVATTVPRGPASPQAPGRIDLPPARLVMAVSYHVCLLALARGVPTVGLAVSEYVGHKLHGLFEAFGRPEWVWAPQRGGDLARLAADAVADPRGADRRAIAEGFAAHQRRWLAAHVLEA